MKCINCGTDNNLKERTENQGRCKECNHTFAFEPTSMGTYKVTDSMFAKAISDISVNHTLNFTPEQLFYFLDNRFRKKNDSSSGCLIAYIIISIITISTIIIPLILAVILMSMFYTSSNSSKISKKARINNAKGLQILGVVILLIGLLSSIFVWKSFLLFIISAFLGIFALYLGFLQINKTGVAQDFLIDKKLFQSWLIRWEEINGSINNKLDSPREENLVLSPVNPEVTNYSFDRLVVCDSANIAQFLIANNFHFENNCAVLSVTGYPQNIFDTMMAMLRQNPELKVYAIHDCSPKGISLVHHLRTSPNWFTNSNITIVDIGLTPRQVLGYKRGMFILNSQESAQEAKQLSQSIRSSVSTEELRWLEAGNFVELSSFTPQKLIQILQRGIAGSSNFQLDGGDALLLGGATGGYIYANESFG